MQSSVLVMLFDAVGRIEGNGLSLGSAAGKLHGCTRHAGRLGRISRNEQAQRADMRAPRRYLSR
jgi:hypothetical protein